MQPTPKPPQTCPKLSQTFYAGHWGLKREKGLKGRFIRSVKKHDEKPDLGVMKMHATMGVRRRKEQNEARGINAKMSAEEIRRKELAAMHVMQKQLGMSEHDAQVLKLDKTGCKSAADMNSLQRKKYLTALDAAMKASGLVQQRKAGKRVHHAPLHTSRADHREERWAYCRGLWTTLWRGGLVHDNTDAALMAFVARQTKTEWRWCNTHQINAVVEALKAWEGRIPK